MPGANSLAGVFRSKYARILTAVLLAQAVLFYTASRGDAVPLNRPLRDFPKQLQDWRMVQEGVIEKEVQEVLRADDIVSRLYAHPDMQAPASLFVAYFKTQRTGQVPHSPKNCLPGSGWVPSDTGYLEVPVSGVLHPIKINRYVVSKGEERSVVLYWYQSRDRVIASEYHAKFWLVADSIRYHRSDTSIIRVVVPVIQNDEDAATQTGIRFLNALFPVLKQYLPS